MQPRLVLASSSPRRIDLMRAAGYRFLIVKPDVDESALKGEKPRRLVRRLALLKARQAARELSPAFAAAPSRKFILISADTIVVSPRGKILGKPTSASDAYRMLALLAGRTHRVLTSYCILQFVGSKEVERVCRVVKTQVHLMKLSRRQIADYVATGEPMDKAGSYAAQGFGMTFIASIAGSYTNVVGLPIAQLKHDLEKVFSFGSKFSKNRI